MHEYQAPLADMKFVLRELVDHELLAQLPDFGEMTLDVADAVLDEAAKFAGGVLSPLNRSGDLEGVRWQEGEVLTAAGWKQAYTRFAADGWGALSCPAEFGGQNLPRALSALVEEMWNGANMAFALCPMLTRGAIDAIELRGTEAQRDTYLPKMVGGEWTGTMNLTEPQAGSDLSAVRTRAVPSGDGGYRLTGQKIFITYGEHDLTGNIIHMVLGRVAGAPEGVRGISLFLVPKFLVNADGSLGERNDVHCVSIEHKLGIHASPTCVLAYGQDGGAVAELIGEENRGLEYMFIMMNAARYSVGLEGIGLSERACQTALAYARERIQSTEAGVRGGPRVPIVRHPDVRRMLLLMKSQTEAMRALSVVVAVSLDAARLHPRAVAADVAAAPKLTEAAAAFSAAIDALERAIRYVVENYATDIRGVSVGAVPMLKLFGIVAGGWQLLRSALISQQRLAAPKGTGADAGFYEAKILTARFYSDHVLSQALGLSHSIVHGAAGALAEGVL